MEEAQKLLGWDWGLRSWLTREHGSGPRIRFGRGLRKGLERRLRKVLGRVCGGGLERG